MDIPSPAPAAAELGTTKSTPVLATKVPVTECSHALGVWVPSTTVGAERDRLGAELSKIRSVFGLYAETSRPAAREVVDRQVTLAGRRAHETLVAEDPEFGATHASKRLPRGARVVGWLEDTGYRAVADSPQPDQAWLTSTWSHLR